MDLRNFTQRSRHRNIGRTAGAGLVALTLLAGSAIAAQAAPIPSNSPTAPPGSFAEANIGADRTAANFFYRIPA
jgi:sialidase-1